MTRRRAVMARNGQGKLRRGTCLRASMHHSCLPVLPSAQVSLHSRSEMMQEKCATTKEICGTTRASICFRARKTCAFDHAACIRCAYRRILTSSYSVASATVRVDLAANGRCLRPH